MNEPHLPLFVNPTAGRGRAGKRLTRILELLADEGIEPEVHESGGVGDLERQVLAAARAGTRRLIVAGGDGSIHEAANGILRSGKETALGVIPVGTGNDFAKASSIPLDWETATRLLADRLASDASPWRVDAARMNRRFFVNGAGIGLDAKVTAIARSYRWPIGDLVYLLAIFRAMADGITTPNIVLKSDDFVHTGPLTLVNISNGAWIGGMFHIAPMADNRDGLLELLTVAPVRRRRIVALLPKLVRGTHMHEEEIAHRSITRLSVRADEPVPSHLDGEVQPLEERFEIEVLPEALSLV